MMKSKKILAVASMALATALFSSCAGMTNVASFHDYWQNNPDANLTAFTETLTYSVEYDANQGSVGYTVSYENGAYSTTLTQVRENEKTYYRYETAFSIKATFAYQAETVSFDDSITSWVTFEKSANNLQPIASHKEIVCHSPTNATTPTELKSCYSSVNYTIDTTYASDLTSGKTVLVNRDSEKENANEESTFSIDDEKVRYVDNEQLYLAMRAINSSSNPTASLLVYAPFTVAVQKVKATFASAEGETLSFKRNGTDVTEAIEWNTASIVLDTNNPGGTQTLWIAKRQENSKTRNVIFKMQIPLSYDMGNFVYKLTSETYTEA